MCNRHTSVCVCNLHTFRIFGGPGDVKHVPLVHTSSYKFAHSPQHTHQKVSDRGLGRNCQRYIYIYLGGIYLIKSCYAYSYREPSASPIKTKSPPHPPPLLPPRNAASVTSANIPVRRNLVGRRSNIRLNATDDLAAGCSTSLLLLLPPLLLPRSVGG